MLIIDAHQHFWQFDPIRDSWIDNSMQVIRKDFLPDQLKPLLKNNGIEGCVAVQADQSETETNFLLDLAEQHSFIKGVVGWVDLMADDVTDRLAYLTQNSLLKGVRHIAQAESEDFFLRKDVQRGIGQLKHFGLTYDILVYDYQLPPAIELVRQFPDQLFVLDHIGKPKISKGMDKEWCNNIKKLAEFQNVLCKLSGMVTETESWNWNKSQFEPFIDVILTYFGTDRIMYGSDWPVCLVAAQYPEQMAIVTNYISSLSENEQSKIMGENAVEFYDLKNIE